METKKENNLIVIDAENAIFGRICSYAAKQALNGNEIAVVNSEKAVITGNKLNTIKEHIEMKQRGGHSNKGPRYISLPYKVLKKGIRGMLPNFRWGQGRQALLRIKCYDGVPEEFKHKEMKKIVGPSHEKYITLKELSKMV